MRPLNKEQLSTILSFSLSPLFLLKESDLTPLNKKAEDLHLHKYSFQIYFSHHNERIEETRALFDEEMKSMLYVLNGEEVSYEGEICYLLEIVPVDSSASIEELHRISTARKVMLEVFSHIDHLDTSEDIYNFILDNCYKAIEQPYLCSLMIVEGKKARIVAKKGFTDDVLSLSFHVSDTFLFLETKGKMDRVVIINDLSKYQEQYDLRAAIEGSDEYLRSTITTPIYVNNELYAILSFDSLSDHAFLPRDEDLLYIVKSNIEIILTNHLMHDQIKLLSLTDPLTQCYNRSYIETYMENHKKDHFSVVMFDLNDLKTINDDHGHHDGDTAIIFFAHTLKNHLGERDIIARIGGDEFIALLYESDEEIQIRMETMQNYFKECPIILSDHAPVHLSFSYGIATYDQNKPFASSVSSADHKMYSYKRKYKQSHHL